MLLVLQLSSFVFSARASYNERLVNGYRALQASFNDERDDVIQLSKDPSLISNLVQTKINRAHLRERESLGRFVQLSPEIRGEGNFP